MDTHDFVLEFDQKKVLEEAAYGLEKPSDWKRTCDVLKCCLLRQLIRFWNRAIMYRRPQVFPTTAKFIISAHVSSSICPSFTGTRPARGHRLSCMLQAVFSSLGLRRWDQPKIRASFVKGSFCRKSFGRNADRWVELLYIGKINRKVPPTIIEMVHTVWVKCRCRNNAKNRLLYKFLLPRNLVIYKIYCTACIQIQIWTTQCSRN